MRPPRTLTSACHVFVFRCFWSILPSKLLYRPHLSFFADDLLTLENSHPYQFISNNSYKTYHITYSHELQSTHLIPMVVYDQQCVCLFSFSVMNQKKKKMESSDIDGQQGAFLMTGSIQSIQSDSFVTVPEDTCCSFNVCLVDKCSFSRSRERSNPTAPFLRVVMSERSNRVHALWISSICIMNSFDMARIRCWIIW